MLKKLENFPNRGRKRGGGMRSVGREKHERKRNVIEVKELNKEE